MNADTWKKRISKLPPRLTQTQAAKLLKQPRGATRLWLIRLNYPFVDGRKLPWTLERRHQRQKFDPNAADWSKENVEIAKEFGVSRERIRQLRLLLKIRKVKGRINEPRTQKP